MNFLSSIFNFYFLQEFFFDNYFLQEKMKKNEGVLQPVFFLSLSLSIILDNSVSQKKR